MRILLAMRASASLAKVHRTDCSDANSCSARRRRRELLRCRARRPVIRMRTDATSPQLLAARAESACGTGPYDHPEAPTLPLLRSHECSIIGFFLGR